MKNCPTSPSGEHEYLPQNYALDDQGFYLDCVHCNRTAFFACDTEDELYERFGMTDDEDDYDERDYEDEDIEQESDKPF